MKRRTPIPHEIRTELLKGAIGSLVADPRFEVFMDELYEMREQSLRDALQDNVVGDTGKMSAALGELRCYTSILNTYQHYLAEPAPIESKE